MKKAPNSNPMRAREVEAVIAIDEGEVVRAEQEKKPAVVFYERISRNKPKTSSWSPSFVFVL